MKPNFVKKVISKINIKAYYRSPCYPKKDGEYITDQHLHIYSVPIFCFTRTIKNVRKELFSLSP